MSTATVVTEQRGTHFVAWVRGDDGQPLGAVLMVGRTPEEAAARLAAWRAEHPGR